MTDSINSWDTPYAIAQKFPKIMEKKKLGGSFAWGLGEDANKFVHLDALTAQMKRFGEEKKSADEGWATELGTNSSLGYKDEM